MNRINSSVPATEPPGDRDQGWSKDDPEIVLYVRDGASAEAGQAFEALAATGLRFRVEPTTGPAERAEFGGMSFEGIDDIRVLAGALMGFSETLLDRARTTMPDLFATVDLAVRQEARERRDQELASARSAMNRLSPVTQR